MKRSELEHIIRAAGEISEEDRIVIIGSQSILGQFPEAPALLSRSMEADIYPLGHPERAEKVDDALGEGSPFHEQFGYYAQGVGPETAMLPDGWQSRLVSVANANTGGVTGLCLEVHDLAISKYAAGREKDREFTRELAKHHMTKKPVLLLRLQETETTAELRKIIRNRINADFRGNGKRR
jgi:hypothetical protein